MKQKLHDAMETIDNSSAAYVKVKVFELEEELRTAKEETAEVYREIAREHEENRGIEDELEIAAQQHEVEIAALRDSIEALEGDIMEAQRSKLQAKVDAEVALREALDAKKVAQIAVIDRVKQTAAEKMEEACAKYEARVAELEACNTSLEAAIGRESSAAVPRRSALLKRRRHV